MRTLLRPLAVLLVAVLLTACGERGLGNAAATVNDDEVPRELVERIVEAQMSGEGAPTEEAERAEATAELQRNVLSTLISIEIVEDLAAEEDVEPTEEEIQEAFEEQVAEYEELAPERGQDPDFDSFLEQIGITAEEYRDLIVADVVRREKLTAKHSDEVTEEDVRAAYEEQAEQQVDARHILVPTEEEAREAIERIEGGEDFAEVAADMSQDGSAQDGGNLGVAPPSRYVPEFAEAITDAEVGELIGPVETQFGFHVIEVLEYVDPAPFEELEPQLRQQLEQAAQQDPELQSLYQEAFQAAEVEVAPGLGSWDPETGQVVDDSEPVGEGTGEAPAPGEQPTDGGQSTDEQPAETTEEPAEQ